MPYNINGQAATIDEEPMEKDGRHYVPVRALAQHLGGTATWDSGNQTAEVKIGDWTADVTAGTPVVNVSGRGTSQQITMSAPAFEENGSLYVPWDFFQSAYGYKANMEGDTLYVRL